VWDAAGPAKSLVAYSHGANSRPDKYDRLFERLAAAGHSVVAPLHVDSPDHPAAGTFARPAQIAMRLEDMRGIFAAHGGDAPKIAAGHSYGAMIAQMIGGAGGTAPEADVKAVMAWSPPGAYAPMQISAGMWKTLARPQLVITGTADLLPGMAPTWDVHRLSFDTAPVPGALFVGEGVDHYFGNIICRPERAVPPQTQQFDDAVAVSLAFLDRVLAGEPLSPLARARVAGKSWVEVKG
jgi:pimeloyl-ACP methyl ester carboxylesterase